MTDHATNDLESPCATLTSHRGEGISRSVEKSRDGARSESRPRRSDAARPALLIIDRDAGAWKAIREALSAQYEVKCVGDRVAAMAFVHEHRPAVAILELSTPASANDLHGGIVTLREILEVDRFTKVVVLADRGDHEVALKAIGAGAYDLISKPLIIEEVRQLLVRCFYVANLERDFHELQRQMEPDGFGGMVGASQAMQAVFASIRKVAASDAPVTILGESGTGKEMVARAIHDHGARRDGPFVAINCSAIPESLLESELFGHEKGAFTGASSQRKGRIESAAKGTLFLDEIGDVPLAIQVKLLRFLQEQTIERVGGRVEMKVDTRILAATNADLEKAMRAGTFREDFFYRLAVIRITLPPLRSRGDDIALIARTFLNRYAAQNLRQGLAFSREALRAIASHSWPGNIRELQNRIRRAVIMAEGSRIASRDLELESAEASTGPSLKEAREDLEREMVQGALRRHGGKIAPAAVELGVSRPTLYDMIERYAVHKVDEQSA